MPPSLWRVHQTAPLSRGTSSPQYGPGPPSRTLRSDITLSGEVPFPRHTPAGSLQPWSGGASLHRNFPLEAAGLTIGGISVGF